MADNVNYSDLMTHKFKMTFYLTVKFIRKNTMSNDYKGVNLVLVANALSFISVLGDAMTSLTDLKRENSKQTL